MPLPRHELVRSVPSVLMGLTRNVGDQRSEYARERRAASEITDQELVAMPCCSIQQDDHISPQNHGRPLRRPAFPPTGVSFYCRTTDTDRDSEGGEDRPDHDRLALRFEQFKESAYRFQRPRGYGRGFSDRCKAQISRSLQASRRDIVEFRRGERARCRPN